MKSGNLNFLEPSGPVLACNGTSKLFGLTRVGLFGLTRVGLFGLTRVGLFGLIRVGLLGLTRVGLFGLVRVGLFGLTRVGLSLPLHSHELSEYWQRVNLRFICPSIANTFPEYNQQDATFVYVFL